MGLLAREAVVTYNGVTVPAAGYILRDIYVSGDGYESSTLEYTFTVQQETTALFATACASVEAAFRVPHQALIITGLGSKSFSHSGRTGFNAVPTIDKIGHPADSGLSRTYRVRIEFGRPADNSSSDGRRVTRTSINVSYTPARRRNVTVAGEWTGITSVSARAQYEAQISSYANGILSALTGTYKLLREPQTTQDDANNVIRISIEYEEILNTDVGGGDSDIRDETVVITRREAQPGDTPSPGFVNRTAHITASYSAYVEKTNTDLKGKWATLRIRLLNQIRLTYALGAVALVEEDPSFNTTDNQITATMTAIGFPGNTVVECHATTEHETDEGVVLIPVWTGNKWDRLKYDGPANEIRVVRITQKVQGTIFGPVGSPLLFPDQFSGRGDLVLKKTTTNAVPEIVGGIRTVPGVPMSTITEVRVYERARIVKGGGGGDTPTQHTENAAGGEGRPSVASGGGTNGGGGGNGGGRP